MSNLSNNLKFLRLKNGLNQQSVQDLIGIKRTAWSNYENDISVPSLADFCKIAKYFDITETDLIHSKLNGTEKLLAKSDRLGALIETKTENMRPKIRPNDEIKNQKMGGKMGGIMGANAQNDSFLPNSQGNISIIDAKAAAGMAAIIEQPQLYNQLPSFSLPMPATRLGAFICIEVRGDSMHPTVKDGEWVIAQQIQEASNIKNGYIHIILTTEGVLCKRLYYEQGKEHLKLVSDNDIYSPTKLPLEDTIAIYKSIMKLSSDFRNWNNDMRRQINAIDARLTALELKKK